MKGLTMAHSIYVNFIWNSRSIVASQYHTYDINIRDKTLLVSLVISYVILLFVSLLLVTVISPRTPFFKFKSLINEDTKLVRSGLS